jgi:hypothetical protein
MDADIPKVQIRSSALWLALLAIAVLLAPVQAMAAEAKVLTVVKVDKAPANLGDPIWGKAKALAIPFEGKEIFAGKKAEVTAKALYAGDRIYFLFNWKDSAKSVTREAWKFDGSQWTHQKGNEDRISILFEIDRITNFATKGCAVLCHVPEGKTAKDGKFGTATATGKGDLWHWKAARSAPYGFADDTWLTAISEKKGGRESDKGAGGDKRNMTDDKSKPKFMLAPGKSLTSDGILLSENAVEITDYSTFKAGDILTFNMPIKPDGSRADIAAESIWKDGSWTVMLSRKLDTGNEDDTPFNTKKQYSFAMALFDDSGDQDSYDSDVLTLKFD